MEDTIAGLVFGALLGAAYGGFMFLSGKDLDNGETFKPRKLARTVVLWAGAGVVAVQAGQSPFNPAGFEGFVGSAGGLGLLFDQAWSMARRKGLLPKWLTGEVEV